MSTHIRIADSSYSDSFELSVWRRLLNGSVEVAQRIVLQSHAENSYATPSLIVSKDEGRPMLQELFNDLWNMGFRPAQQFPDSAGVIVAKDEHIKDLRRMVWPDSK